MICEQRLRVCGADPAQSGRTSAISAFMPDQDLLQGDVGLEDGWWIVTTLRGPK
jgi:hypothetical protein